MSPTASFSPEAIQRMTSVYNRALQELKLERAPATERERLAVYILSIGNTLKDQNRMLDRAVRMYRRLAKVDGLPFPKDNASSAFESRSTSGSI